MVLRLLSQSRYCGPALRSASAPAVKWGIHPSASDRLRAAGVPASQVMRTIGSAAASAGTHGTDGYVNGQPYSCATDLSARGMSDAEVCGLLERLGRLGIAGWYRNPGHDGWPSSEIRHMHVVFAGAKMKSSLRSQINDYHLGRNALAWGLLR